jgi:hypothetical protein
MITPTGDPPLWWRDFLVGDFGVWNYWQEYEGYYSPCIPYYEPRADSNCWQYDFYIDPCEVFVLFTDCPCMGDYNKDGGRSAADLNMLAVYLFLNGYMAPCYP